MKQLPSFRRNIKFSIKLNNIGFSPLDKMRYVLGNGRVTLANGHYALLGSSLLVILSKHYRFFCINILYCKILTLLFVINYFDNVMTKFIVNSRTDA